jgi:hypothetical protein
MGKNKLNFGCGIDIKKGWDNVDKQEGEGVISFNFDDYPYPLKKDNYDYILMKQVLNFVSDADKCLFEIWKYGKDNAIIDILLPYHNNKGAYNDIQTKHFFSDSTFRVFIENQPCKIEKQKKFELIEINLIPTNYGKLFPKKIREKLAVFVGGLIAELSVKIRIKK